MIPLENISYSLEKLNRNFFPLYPLHKILVHQIQGPFSNLVIFYYFQRYPKFSPSLSKSSSTFKSGKWYIEGGYLNKNLHITAVSLPPISNVVKRVTMLYGSLVGCATTIEGAAQRRGANHNMRQNYAASYPHLRTETIAYQITRSTTVGLRLLLA